MVIEENWEFFPHFDGNTIFMANNIDDKYEYELRHLIDQYLKLFSDVYNEKFIVDYIYFTQAPCIPRAKGFWTNLPFELFELYNLNDTNSIIPPKIPAFSPILTINI